MGYESMSEQESGGIHIYDRAVVQPGPAAEPWQESCPQACKKPPPLGKATGSEGSGCHCQRKLTGHFRKTQNRCHLAASPVLLGNSQFAISQVD